MRHQLKDILRLEGYGALTVGRQLCSHESFENYIFHCRTMLKIKKKCPDDACAKKVYHKEDGAPDGSVARMKMRKSLARSMDGSIV